MCECECECVCVEMSTVCSVVDEIEMKKKEQTKEKRENRKENEKRTKKKIEFCVAFKERAGKNPCRGLELFRIEEISKL